MTKEELKQILASPENRMAKNAKEIIESGDDSKLEDLKVLITNGCPDIYYERDPSHPRTRYLTHHLIDSCFLTSFGVVETKQNTATLGFQCESKRKSIFFELLLQNNFRPGLNSSRGPLFEHILNCCFYPSFNKKEEQRKEIARLLATILTKYKKFDIQRYANNNYQWVSDTENLAFLISLGANPKDPAMIDCALKYYACSPNSKESPDGRTNVIKKLLSLGGKPKENLNCRISHIEIKKKLEESKLLKTMTEFGIA